MRNEHPPLTAYSEEQRQAAKFTNLAPYSPSDTEIYKIAKETTNQFLQKDIKRFLLGLTNLPKA